MVCAVNKLNMGFCKSTWQGRDLIQTGDGKERGMSFRESFLKELVPELSLKRVSISQQERRSGWKAFCLKPLRHGYRAWLEGRGLGQNGERRWSGRMRQDCRRVCIAYEGINIFGPKACGKVLFLNQRMALSHLPFERNQSDGRVDKIG